MLILRRSIIWQGAGQSIYRGCWLATAVVRVEGKTDWEVGNELCTRNRYPQEQDAINIIVMVLGENDNTSILYIFLYIAQHFPPNSNNDTR